MEHYDLAVIGGGSAGLTAAITAGRLGARVVLIDRERLGGDCLYYGCVPSKAIIKCARVAHTVRNAARFGCHVQDSGVDFAEALKYVWDAVKQVGEHETPEALAAMGVEVAFGGARYLSPTHIQAGERELVAERSIIAVGSRAVAPPIPGLAEVGYIDHVKFFHLDRLPGRLAVIGGGPIGMELGQTMARFGSRVTVLEMSDRILPRDDEELTEMLRGILQDELELINGAQVTRVESTGAQKAVVYQHRGGEEKLECDEILVAVGRRPNLEELDLERIGVETTRAGIVVDPTLRTTRKNIWACGDCVGSYQFTHFAEAQARVAVRNALFRGAKKFDGQVMPWTTFTDPELAHVGMLETDAAERQMDVHVYRFPYAHLDRAVCEGEAKGMAKVVCSKRGRILGASLLGPHAGEAISEFVIAMNTGMTLQQVSGVIHVYPTMNRIVRRLGDERFLREGVSSFVKAVFGRFQSLEKEL